MLGLCSNYFSRYGFPRLGISRRDLLYRTTIKLDRRWNSAPFVKVNGTDAHLWTAITPVPVGLQSRDFGRTSVLSSPKCTPSFMLIASGTPEIVVEGSRHIHAISSHVQPKTSSISRPPELLSITDLERTSAWTSCIPRPRPSKVIIRGFVAYQPLEHFNTKEQE